MNWKISFIFVIVFVLLITGFIFLRSKNTDIMSQQNSFDNRIWDRSNIVELSIFVTPEMIDKDYDLYLDIEHTVQIKKDKMLIDMEIILPNQEERISTYSVWYKNNEGKFKGTPHENLYDLHQILRRSFIFSQEGKWLFKIQQRSEYQYLEGIKSIQLVATPSEKIKKE